MDVISFLKSRKFFTRGFRFFIHDFFNASMTEQLIAVGWHFYTARLAVLFLFSFVCSCLLVPGL